MKFEDLIFSHNEALQYSIFFASLFTFGILEHLRPAHVSHQNRLSRWPVNFVITILNVFALGTLPLTIITVAQYVQKNNFGLFNLIENPNYLVVFGTLISRGFISWLNHLLMHKVPLFWRIHQVHHLDTHLDISTTVRFHPLEFVVNLAVSLPLVALIGGPAWVYLIYEILDAGINVFSHSNIQLPKKLNTILSWFVVTPNVHQVHHSAFQPETDCNFGAVFTIWDRLLGTYRVKEWPFESNFRFGLEYWRERQFNTIWFLISAPFRKQGSMRK